MPSKNPKAKVFYVYALVDPRDGLPFYIGKGSGSRCHHHVRDWRAGKVRNDRKCRQISSIMAAGLDVQVSIVAEHLTEQQAYQRERAEIAAERKTRCLTNLFPGMRTDAERALDQVNYNLSRFRTPEQYTFALLRELRRLPTTQEWGWYFESLEWFAELKERLIKELTDDGSPNGLQA